MMDGSLLEEVTFRTLAGHLHEADRGQGIATTIFLSVLRGLWHPPLAGPVIGKIVVDLLRVHIPVDVCLALYWRNAESLLFPGLAHALRNAFTVDE